MKFLKSLWNTFLSGILLIFFYEWTFIEEYGLNGIIMGLVAGLIMSFLWGALEWAFFPHTRIRKFETEFDILPIQNKKYLLKMFLFNTIAFGIFMGTIELAEHGIIGLLVGLLCGGVAFGSFMILNNKISVQNKLKKLDIKMFEGAMGVQHIRNMELNIPYDKTFELCLASPGFIKKYNVINAEPAEGRIKVEIGKLNKNMILFDIQKIDNKRTQVKILTKPVEKSIIMDSGLNLENIEKITRFLKEQETA
ncbi:MAG: hypothetical protein PHE49_00790 [bacterium]|nr:hypothetical protein [bacterium]